ncbi:MAG: hypothetical protein J5884_06495 [Paludibacteraceae bacterium]|nr:hypothetical protein [Paludibacteraceae bacterium]
MKRIALMMALAALVMLGVKAQQPARVPAYRGLIERVQPNGDTLRTYLRGDERMHWMMTEDGWQILETKSKWYKYAKKNYKGEIVAGKKAKNAEDRSKCEQRWLERKGIKREVGTVLKIER